MLANGKYRKIIASTLPEIKGCLPLVKEGMLDEVSYTYGLWMSLTDCYQAIFGLPVHRSVLQQLTTLRPSLRILLLVDHPSQLPVLEASAPSAPWDVFIKLDVGSHRAGVSPASDALHTLVKAAEASPAVRIHGFYCHANHSYGGRTRKDAEETLKIEWDSVIGAAKMLPADRTLVCSVGATPTAHVVEAFKADAPTNIKLELHAGTYLL